MVCKMAAVDIAGISATKLGDLPGNQLPTLQYNLMGKIGNENGSPSFNDITKKNAISDKGTENAKFNQTSPYKRKTLVPPLPLTARSSLHFDSNRNATSSVDTDSQTSSKSLNSNEARRGDVSGTPPSSSSDRWQTLNARKERTLLNNLLKLDDEEDSKLYFFPNDDDVYRQWKSNEQQTSKKPVSTFGSSSRYSKNIPSKTSSDVVKQPSSNNLTKKSNKANKINTLSGWETDLNKLYENRRNSERKQKIYKTSNTNGLEKANLHDKYTTSGPGADFKFFHYTNIGLYMQQYRKNHVFGSPSSSSHDSAMFLHSFASQLPSQQEISERSLCPVRLDHAVSTEYMRHRLTSSNFANLQPGGPQTITEHPVAKIVPQKPPDVSKCIEDTRLPGTISPATLHPPLQCSALKSNSATSNSSLLTNESNSRQNITIGKSWNWKLTNDHRPTELGTLKTKLLEESSETNLQISSGLAMDDVSFREPFKSRRKTKGTAAPPDGRSMPSVEHRAAALECSETDELKRPQPHSPEHGLYDFTRRPEPRFASALRDFEIRTSPADDVTPYQIHHKSFHMPRTRLQQVEDSVRLARDDFAAQENLRAEGRWAESPERSVSTSPDRGSNSPHTRGVRLKALIAAEIQNLQQRKVMTSDQRHKLDTFRRALSNSSYHSPVPSPSTSPEHNGKIIAGSVRAFYARLANNEFCSNQRERFVRRNAKVAFAANSPKEDVEGNKPIIYVSQTGISPTVAADKPASKEPLSKPGPGKRIIGGVAKSRPTTTGDPAHFTRITDLLRIKKRRQNASVASAQNTRKTTITQKLNRVRKELRSAPSEVAATNGKSKQSKI